MFYAFIQPIPMRHSNALMASWTNYPISFSLVAMHVTIVKNKDTSTLLASNLPFFNRLLAFFYYSHTSNFLSDFLKMVLPSF